ncbi:MAG: hypothetical protein ACRENB_05255 [Gemmatimonadales bacterium]
MRSVVLHLLFGAGAALSACSDAPPAGPQDPHDRLGVWLPSSGVTFLHSPRSGLENPTLIVVSFPAAWQALWSQAWGGASAAPPLPEVDFVLSSVVVVGLGKRAGLGYFVTIDSIVTRTTGAVLYATESLPGANCQSAGISAPVHMVHAPGHPPVVEWRMSMLRRDCPP